MPLDDYERPRKKRRKRRDDDDDDAPAPPRTGLTGSSTGDKVLGVIASIALLAVLVGFGVSALRKKDREDAANKAANPPEQPAGPSNPAGPLDPDEREERAGFPALVPKRPVDEVLAGPLNPVYLADMIEFGPPNDWQQVVKGAHGTGHGTPIQVGEFKWAKGLSATRMGPRRTRIGYALGGKAATLNGYAGVCNECTDATAPFAFTILGDGKELWQATARRGEKVPFRVDVRGVKVLELRALAPPNQKAHLAVWLDPFVEK